jgi:16S rRNA (guanine527-N7)-methyltransferase
VHRNFLINKYVHVLKTWNKKVNLVQADSLKQVMDRHVRDSEQICSCLEDDSKIIDVGSGAGFPGVILSIYGYQNVVLCENNYKKIMFLNDVKQKLGLNFEIFGDDIYNFPKVKDVFCKMQNSVMVSRAFGTLSELMNIMNKVGISQAVFHKSRKCLLEFSEASRYFKFRFLLKRSVTSDEGIIILLNNVIKV